MDINQLIMEFLKQQGGIGGLANQLGAGLTSGGIIPGLNSMGQGGFKSMLPGKFGNQVGGVLQNVAPGLDGMLGLLIKAGKKVF